MATRKSEVEDYHFGNSSKILFRDTKKSYQIIGGDQNMTHTKIAFRRRWNTCDSNDSVLGSDTVLISWSIHPNDEIDKDLSNLYSEETIALPRIFHGQKYLLLQAPAQMEIPKGHNVHQWDVLMRNVIISNKTATQYWCKVFRNPPLPKKSHIVAYKPMILSNNTDLIHHMFLYECDVPPGFLDSYASSNQNGYPCYTDEMPSDWEKCITPVAIWVVGGGRKVFPDHIGLPIGPRQTYFMLEIHYRDPGPIPVIDNSGFRLYHTEELRPFDAGILMTGVKVTPLHLVPPGQMGYRSVGLCNDVCTNKLFPRMGIKIVSVLLHSHIPASSVRLRHVRGDGEMNPIVENNKYEYSHQVDQRLKEEVTVFPSDHLITECDYTTTDETSPAFGSRFSKEEMCSSFVTYYPRTNLSSCHSMTPVRHFFKALGIKSFYNVTMDDIETYVMKTISNSLHKMPSLPAMSIHDPDTDAVAKLVKILSRDNGLLKLTINEPNEFRGKNLSKYVESLPWADMLFTKSFESSLANGLQIVLCRFRNNKLAIAPNIESFPKFTELPERGTQECLLANGLEGSSSVSTKPVGILTSLLTLVYLFMYI
ncbi:hypothetical protein RUM44_008976 [Polyplax serrata]|uniref:Uncharacterized protein n=1 Tax=Polyplax serrata TaxID=468196 RepID=A0ABR1ARD2_POLSC